MTIETFISLVDKMVQNKCGVSVHDLPDFCFADYFEEDFTAEETREAAADCAMELLQDAGFDDE